MARAAIRVLILVSAFLMGAGCSTPIERPTGPLNQSLGFVCAITPAWRHHNPAVTIAVEIDQASLTFVKTGNGFLAVYETSVALRNQATGEPVAQEAWADSIFFPTYEATQISAPRVSEHRLSLEPGRYTSTIRIEDRESGESAEREVTCELPDVESGRPLLSPVLLTVVRDSTGHVPVISDNLPCAFDSLSALVETFNLPTDSTTLLEIHLLRGNIDSLPAFPPTSNALLRVPQSRGIFHGISLDTIRNFDVRFRPAQSSTRFALPLAPLGPGSYLAEFLLRIQDSALAARRAFFIRGPTFPRPSLLEELIDPLRYIATEDEMAEMQVMSSPTERRSVFERFWLARATDSQRASQLIRLYYDRVEAANRTLTTYKEGWRTDRGMVLIVAGPPDQMERKGELETWFYTDNNNRPAGLFQFKRVESTYNESLLRNYILLRSPRLGTLWGLLVHRWRSGEVR